VRINDSGDGGLGLDPLYKCITSLWSIAQDNRNGTVHTTHINRYEYTLFEKVGRCIDLSVVAQTHAQADAHTYTYRTYTRCNIGSLTGPKAGTRKTSAGAAAIA